jgi:hypothetical protein
LRSAGSQEIGSMTVLSEGEAWHVCRGALAEPLERRYLLSGQLFPGQVFGVSRDPEAVATADFNADGRPDVVTANSSGSRVGQVSMLLANASGGFLPAVNVGAAAWVVTTGDFTGDEQGRHRDRGRSG